MPGISTKEEVAGWLISILEGAVWQMPPKHLHSSLQRQIDVQSRINALQDKIETISTDLRILKAVCDKCNETRGEKDAGCQPGEDKIPTEKNRSMASRNYIVRPH